MKDGFRLIAWPSVGQAVLFVQTDPRRLRVLEVFADALVCEHGHVNLIGPFADMPRPHVQLSQAAAIDDVFAWMGTVDELPDGWRDASLRELWPADL